MLFTLKGILPMILSSSPISILEFDTLVIEKVAGAAAATRASDSLLIHSSLSLALSVAVVFGFQPCLLRLVSGSQKSG